jgi:hypothetical protein
LADQRVGFGSSRGSLVYPKGDALAKIQYRFSEKA